MPAPRREILALCSRLLLTLPLGVAAACRGSSRSKAPRNNSGAPKAPTNLRLPPPLAIPSPPPLWLHSQNPQLAWSWLPGTRPGVSAPRDGSSIPDLRQLFRFALRHRCAPDMLGRLTAAIDPQRPWQWMILDSRTEILRFSVHPSRLGALQQLLSSLRTVADFGARQLPPAPPPTQARNQSPGYLVWTGPQGRELIIAPHPRALVTALHFPPVQANLDLQLHSSSLSPERRAQFAQGLLDPAMSKSLEQDLKKVVALGNKSTLKVHLDFQTPQANPLHGLPIAPGALPELLQPADFVWGVSTRYTEGKKEVRKLLRMVDRQVATLPFFVQGAAKSLRNKLKRSLGHWNERTLVGLDAAQHLRLALGADNLPQSQRDILSFLRELVASLDLARSFTNRVPSIRLRKNAAQYQGQQLHQISIGTQGFSLPAELRPLLGSDRRLHLAFCWSPRFAAILVQIGPQALLQLQRWLGPLAQSAPDPSADSNNWLALKSAVDATTLERLAQQRQNVALAQLLGLSHAGAHTERTVGLSRTAPQTIQIAASRPLFSS